MFRWLPGLRYLRVTPSRFPLLLFQMFLISLAWWSAAVAIPSCPEVNTAVTTLRPPGQRSSLCQNQSAPNKIKAWNTTFVVDLIKYKIDHAWPPFRFLETPGSAGIDLTVVMEVLYCQHLAAFGDTLFNFTEHKSIKLSLRFKGLWKASARVSDLQLDSLICQPCGWGGGCQCSSSHTRQSRG